MLQLNFSNRFENLLDSLIDDLTGPSNFSAGSLFVPEEIIVPSLAVRRRLELAVADRVGICANVRFPFLAQWLWRQMARVVPSVAEVSPYAASALRWRVLALLEKAGFGDPYPELKSYLAHSDPVMRFDLATRIGGLFEQYLAYRPEWLEAWGKGRGLPERKLGQKLAVTEAWQKAIWHELAVELGTSAQHPSAAFFAALEELGPDGLDRTGLPKCARIFGVAGIPPLYVQILAGLAQWIDIRLYVPNPCKEYWLEAVDSRRLAWLDAQGRADHHETGNRLLAAWGKQTQAGIEVLYRELSETDDHASFAATEARTMLGALQDAILAFEDPLPGALAEWVNDRSIEVHVCHSRTRELEVLQDQLLALFAGANQPRPEDIAVLLPDLETAAPLIDAVFGNAPPGRRIPYTITGRPASEENPVGRALLAVLDVAGSRFAASAVYELLLQPAIARRFDLVADELETIHRWMAEGGIRWGLDAQHRAALDLPPTERFSFADGLDRLFLGYALPSGAHVPVQGRLPAGNAEGSAALALGSFATFIRALERLHGELATPHTANEWRDLLVRALETFLQPAGEEIDAARAVRAGIQALRDAMAQGGEATGIAFAVVRAALAEQLDESAPGAIPTGAVTFAPIAGLRGLPYRFVCVLGLDFDAFPAVARPVEFDLMAALPRPGDRQRREDDRNVFLDLLLAARDRFYLSHTGRSVRDNSPIPPSVLVSELLDYLAPLLVDSKQPRTAEALAAARAQLVVEHPLQPFSSEYFEPDAPLRRRSFNAEYCAALEAQRSTNKAGAATDGTGYSRAASQTAGRGDAEDDADDDERAVEPQQPFFAVPLPDPGPEYREVTLDQLMRFFRNPCRYLLKERLGINLVEASDELQDDEPFVAAWEARSALAQRLLPMLLSATPASPVELVQVAMAGTEYPPGRLGVTAVERELAEISRFAAMLQPRLAPALLPPFTGGLDFSLGGESWRLTATFSDVRPLGLVRYRYDETRPSDYLAGWIEHLAFAAFAFPGTVAETWWVSRDAAFSLRPLEDASTYLGELLSLYRMGLTRPLHFFPKSAWAYVAEDNNLGKAAKKWTSTPFHPWGEDRDAYCQLALRGIDDPLDDEFVQTATAVFAPLREHISDGRLI